MKAIYLSALTATAANLVMLTLKWDLRLLVSLACVAEYMVKIVVFVRVWGVEWVIAPYFLPTFRQYIDAKKAVCNDLEQK